MPSGKTHDFITLITTPAVAITGLAVTQNTSDTIVLTGAYVFAASMFSGDLDLNSVQTRRWGPLSILWKPYQKFGHRSIWTHGVFLGTAVRILYVLMWLTLGVFLLDTLSVTSFGVKDFYTFLSSWIKDHPTYSTAILIGLLLGAFSHTAADLSVSYTKRKLKNYGIMKSRRK